MTVSIIRYGNVMYSPGSVIPLYGNQIQKGEPLSLTEPSMARFLMSLEDPVDLVDHAFSNAQPADLFIEKASASTVEVLVWTVASLLGNDDPEIHVIGLRHGEKLDETLLSREEIVKTFDEGDYFRVPLDARSLRYELYFDEGQTTISRNDDYTSENTHRLDVEETKQLLMRLPEIWSQPVTTMTRDDQDGRSSMPSVAMTGMGGFLGWHTRGALREKGLTAQQIPVGREFDSAVADAALSEASRLIHLAGVNRAGDDEIRDGNVLFAQQIADALRRSDAPPTVVVYADSIQAGNGTVYGDAKAEAADIRGAAASDLGLQFHDLRLPNLFGEHGRPFYNAVTATFCHILAEGGHPKVENNKELTLLHAQNAADLLIGNASLEDQGRVEVRETVSGLLERLAMFARVYRAGEIPDIATPFDRGLFNTYRSYTFETQTPIRLTRHADGRGSFFEIIRSHGGPGQSSFSTTIPGITRGDHFHRRKIERFTVLAGRATIALRRLFPDQVYRFEVVGDEPAAIDMPTMWTHNITNSGDEVLYTSFWTSDIFDPANPDTIAERV